MDNSPAEVVDPEHPQSLLRSLAWQRPETKARGELVWNAGIASVRTEEAGSPADGPEETVGAQRTAEMALEHEELIAAAPIAEPVDDELARDRQEALARLDAEIDARRLELLEELERQRARAQERIAAAERLELEALARRQEHSAQLWDVEQPRRLAEVITTAVSAELAGVKARQAQLDARMRERFEARRQEETARLEAWRASERARTEAELAREEELFHERLMRQLQQFEEQLAARMEDQETRLASCWSAVEDQARERLNALLDEALGGAASSGS